MIIWFTGLPCSGKTTLARRLAFRLGAEHLDGDGLRDTVFAKSVGFSVEEREQHLLRVSYMASLLNKYNNVVCSFVAPDDSVRLKLRADMWFYTKCSRIECSRRDIKGMWDKALKGEISNFTGVDGPFDEPSHLLNCHIIDTEFASTDESFDKILQQVGYYMLKHNIR